MSATGADDFRLNGIEGISCIIAIMIETYYDFRSPYAYFANWRARKGLVKFASGVEFVGRPVSIDVLLNLQAERGPSATYIDDLHPGAPISLPTSAACPKTLRRTVQTDLEMAVAVNLNTTQDPRDMIAIRRL